MPRNYQDILDFLISYWKANHFSPSIREIADHFQTSTSVINYYLLKLEALHYIEPRTPKLSRNIVPTDLGNHIDLFQK